MPFVNAYISSVAAYLVRRLCFLQLVNILNHGAPRKFAATTGASSTETSGSKHLHQDWTSRRSKSRYRRKNNGSFGQTTTAQSQLLGSENIKGEANLNASIEEFWSGLVGGFFDDINRIMGINSLVRISPEQKTRLMCSLTT